MAEHQVLFCPFCRESFEAQRVCPEHELALVSFDRLPPSEAFDDDDEDDALAGAQPDPSTGASVGFDAPGAPPTAQLDDRAHGLLEPRFGRAPVFLGAMLNLVALGLPLVGGEALTTYQLARGFPSLWTLMLVSFTVAFTLARRRTPRRLRSLRVLIPLLSLLSPLALIWTSARLGHPSLGAAVYVVGAASLLLLVGGARLGGPPSLGRLAR
jgi:hypothetical protein